MAAKEFSAPLIGCDGGRIEGVWKKVMSKKGRKKKRTDRQSKARSMSWLAGDGLHTLLPGTRPSPEILADMTRTYQQNIRESPLWEQMVREFGEKEAERILREFRVEIG